ncbi:MAG: protein kinase [Acidobacteriota bacterium]
MSLAPGTQLGPYEVIALIGQGGMGEVYRAHDTRLRRDVAIKVSAAQFSERFLREARAIASLNHPNICTLFDIGPNYLVMEYIEGPTLQERIKAAPIPLEESLAIARQMAAALEAAHEKAIVHRDLKPANVKLTASGIVKVLDFGLAKMAEQPSEPMSENTPTLTLASATIAGTVLGTAAYMAPEQARGKTVDKRADIWAFGVVVYEMLTGSRLFQGETLSDTLIDVATKHPDWEPVPPQLLRLLKRCLEKDPQKRLRDIGDMALLLEELPAAAIPALVEAPTPAPRRSLLPWAVAALGLAAATVALWAPWRPLPNLAPVVLDIFPEKGQVLGANHPAISPDGRSLAMRVAVAGVFRLAVRRLDSVELRILPGTEDANYPDWSPDSRSLVFAAQGKLKRIEVAGGPAQTLCDWSTASIPFMSWGSAGVIVFPGPSNELQRVSEKGGTPQKITTLDTSRNERRHGIPQFLPDGKRFLFFAQSNDPEKSALFAASIDGPATQKPTLVMRVQRNAFYSRSQRGDEYLLFEREGALMAQAFDSSALKLSGEAFLVLPDIASNTDHPYVTASTAGALAYSRYAIGNGTFQYRWRDRAGKQISDVGAPGNYVSFSLSPDEQRVALFQAPAGANNDIYVLDLARNALVTRFTFDPATDHWPVWSRPDGRTVTFTRGGKLFQKPIEGTATEQPLADLEGSPLDWSRDGRHLCVRPRFPPLDRHRWQIRAIHQKRQQ